MNKKSVLIFILDRKFLKIPWHYTYVIWRSWATCLWLQPSFSLESLLWRFQDGILMINIKLGSVKFQPSKLKLVSVFFGVTHANQVFSYLHANPSSYLGSQGDSLQQHCLQVISRRLILKAFQSKNWILLFDTHFLALNVTLQNHYELYVLWFIGYESDCK